MKGRAGLRAWKFEKRIEEGRGGRWARRWGGREEEEGEGYEFNRMGKREREEFWESIRMGENRERREKERER